MIDINSVVQFTEDHEWCGCLGIVVEDKGQGHPRRFMIAVPVPEKGTAFIYDNGERIEDIGPAVMIPGEED